MPAAALVWTHVDSSNVKRVAHHEATDTLCVEFHGGGLYTYSGVDGETYASLTYADSVGQYLNRVIKVMYPYTRHQTEADLLQSL